VVLLSQNGEVNAVNGIVALVKLAPVELLNALNDPG
jgi:hypothetical protein